MKQLKLTYLTDELIALYSQDNVLTEYRDADLHYSYPNGRPNSLYDQRIFGSFYPNRCNCGLVTVVGKECKKCHAKVNDPITANSIYARIELPFYYCNELRFPKLVEWLRSKFVFNFNLVSDVYHPSLNQAVLETLQFEFNEESNSIEVTDQITDVSKCSYEGLLAIIAEFYRPLLQEYLTFINSYCLVTPLARRPGSIVIIGSEKQLVNDPKTTLYKNIIYAVHEFYNKQYDSDNLDTPAKKAVFKACFRRFVAKIYSQISGLLLPSKANTARCMQATRLNSSGRCTIVPAPDLKANEVYIPRHLMYECCETEFIQFMKDKLNCNEVQAKMLYKKEATSDKVQQLFTEYINGTGEDDAKYVLINRAPTLHELNIMCCRVKLTEDYCMKIPMVICSPFNADFDGDAMTFYAIPKAKNAYFNEAMNPRNLIYYKKNHKPLFTPTHEIMLGLITATKVILGHEDDLIFDSVEEAVATKKTMRDFKWQTLITIKGKKTTLAREKLSELFVVDLNVYLESKGDTNLNSKNIIPLYVNLEHFDDRLDRIQLIQEFALLISTISGATVPRLSQLYTEIDKESIEKMKIIEQDRFLSREEKILQITDIYKQFMENETKNFDEGIKLTVTESSRAKIGQLMGLVLPLVNISPDGNVTVGNTRLIEGMSQRDYINMVIETRGIKDIKVGAVPLGGYLTRQFAFLAMDWTFRDSYDEGNKGILIKSKYAKGRTRLDGSIVQQNDSDDYIMVRSVVTSTLKNMPIITKDMIPDMFNYHEGASIGISMMTSLTEGLTQSGLALKHGGNLFQIDPNGELYANFDCTISLTEGFIVITDEHQKAYALPKSSSFILSYKPGNRYKKGELIGAVMKLGTPSYKLMSMIKLCGAKGTNRGKKFTKNKINVADCYACNDGTLTYKRTNNGIKVFIDNVEYRYDPDSLYFIPDGTYVKKYTRICSGVMDRSYISNRVHSYVENYYFFRNQFTDIMGDSISQELIEFLYTILTRQVDGKIKILNVANVIKQSKSIYSSLAFESARKRLTSIPLEGESFKFNTLAQVVLPLLLKEAYEIR
jgi:hypothetical protein